jgi:hypothetical protein
MPHRLPRKSSSAFDQELALIDRAKLIARYPFRHQSLVWATGLEDRTPLGILSSPENLAIIFHPAR